MKMRWWFGWLCVVASAIFAVAQELPPTPTPLVVVCCQGELGSAERLRQAAEQGATLESLKTLAAQEGFELVEHDAHHYALSRTLLTFPETVEANVLECLMHAGGSLAGTDCSSAKRFVAQNLKQLTIVPELAQSVTQEVGLPLEEWLEHAAWSLQLAGKLTASRNNQTTTFVGDSVYLSAGADTPQEKRAPESAPTATLPLTPCNDYHFLYTSAIPLSQRTDRARDALSLIKQRESQAQRRLSQLFAQLQSHYRAELAGRTLPFRDIPPEIQQHLVESALGFDETGDASAVAQGTYTFFVTPEVTIRFAYEGKSWLVHVYLLPNMSADMRPVGVGLPSR
ncbi:MAG: hypothetical protein CFK49_00230 [Armatimonadetes bacterium JP3_11]|nr:MAG: hypothetical protein CFK49_00230 [Armatimonadetes bacterium JP3_11]